MNFDPIAESLRAAILRYYGRSDEQLSGEAGRNTLETNSVLAERRGAALVRMVESRGLSLRGRRLLDLGCGFGALSLYFAARGAKVVAVDPNGRRMRVGREVAEAYELPVEFRRQSMEELSFRDGGFGVAVMNNSLCYLVERERRARALAEAHRVLRPEGLLVIRNPNRLNPIDQFTGMPLIALLPPAAAERASALAGRRRSRVALRSGWGAARELRSAGFREIRAHSQQPGTWRAALRSLARYQHLSAFR